MLPVMRKLWMFRAAGFLIAPSSITMSADRHSKFTVAAGGRSFPYSPGQHHRCAHTPASACTAFCVHCLPCSLPALQLHVRQQAGKSAANRPQPFVHGPTHVGPCLCFLRSKVQAHVLQQCAAPSLFRRPHPWTHCSPDDGALLAAEGSADDEPSRAAAWMGSGCAALWAAAVLAASRVHCSPCSLPSV